MNLQGVPVGGVTGFVKFLSKFCQAFQPTNCVVFFDGKNGSAKRKTIFKEYKSGRKPRTIIGRQIGFESIDAAAKNQDYQFKALMEILETLPVNVIKCDDFEADDGIGFFIKNKQRYTQTQEEDVVIVSCDKDFLQLLSDNVNIYNPISKKIITKENVVENYEVAAVNWLFYRSVTGDKSDNLNGVSGIGAKTLKKVFDVSLNERFTIDSIKNLNEENKIAKKLKESIDIIERNEKLMSLSEPLISLLAAERLDYQIRTFEPRLDKKSFIIKASTINNIDISMAINFNSLLTRKNNERKSEI